MRHKKDPEKSKGGKYRTKPPKPGGTRTKDYLASDFRGLMGKSKNKGSYRDGEA